jgi:hypothetical protein
MTVDGNSGIRISSAVDVDKEDMRPLASIK